MKFWTFEKQLNEYFTKKEKLLKFHFKMVGSPFQVNVGKNLKFLWTKTISIKNKAIRIEMKSFYRAVANANGQNMIDILIPCHRVISSDENKLWI